MKAPRLLQPLTRTRARLALTLGLVTAALLVGLLPLLPRDTPAGERAGSGTDATPADDSRPVNAAVAMAEARERGEEVVVEAETTPTSITRALPDGQYETTIHALPQRALDADGEWADIDTTLQHTGAGISPVNSITPLVFSPGSRDGDRGSRAPRRDPFTENGPGDGSDGGTVLAELTIEGHTLTYTWPGPLPEPTLDGPRALYPEVVDGVDLLVVAREEGGFAQLLIVKSRDAVSSLDTKDIRYGLSSPTAVFEHDPVTGGVRVLDGEGGEEITSVPTPYAWDSAGREPTDPTDPQAPEPPEPRTDTSSPTAVLDLTGLTGIEPGAAHAPIPTLLDGDGTSRAVLRLNADATTLFEKDADTLYPVFLDPTLVGGVHSWTIAYKPHPNSSFFNGTNFGGGTSEARVGYESQTGGLARSFWRMRFDNSLSGAVVSSATFKVKNTHSWSCETREFQLWLTSAISSSTTWNKQPEWRTLQQRRSFAHGYSSGCPDEFVSFNIKNAAQTAVDSKWATITLGMRATTETSTYTWRKFAASSAEINVVYNRPPNEPVNGTTSPGGACVPGPGAGVTVAKTDIVISARGTDPDGTVPKLRFRVWRTGESDNKLVDRLITPASNGQGSITVPASQLSDGRYSWDVRSEDSVTSGSYSTYFPPGPEPCRFTVDSTAPVAPILSAVGVEDTEWDSGLWARDKKFGDSISFTIRPGGNASEVSHYRWAWNGVDYTTANPNSSGVWTQSLRPPNAGPVAFHVYAYDAAGNRSERSQLLFYLPPRDEEDGPGDLNGDGHPDLLNINGAGVLRGYAAEAGGEVYSAIQASYDSAGTRNPPGHFFDTQTGEHALISKHSDYYPGDGLTDLFARTPDGGFWLYPGDGYGSFNVDKRIKILLPDDAPAPNTWQQIKAVGDVTGDGKPDLFLRAGTGFWVLTGYTGASFREAILMWGSSWGGREIVNVADIDKDGTPDLLWRNPSNGNMYVRHGKPGPVAGSVDLKSLTLATESRSGDVQYGTSWTTANVPLLVGVPDTNGDGVPDIWAIREDGTLRIYHPSTTNTGSPVKTVATGWGNVKYLG
ncbi:FG-GAP-like repeat-containing protein [Streptomyces alkaliphilus]|uniref:FG-GAP-like repeat-containing protein n=1 Tax=Streptomyces alkaliphilus TaxID=1472722 RepID=UPI00117DC11B|nr:DNRLRE domain-containing protein [Streptomyces alkaliphilus]